MSNPWERLCASPFAMPAAERLDGAPASHNLKGLKPVNSPAPFISLTRNDFTPQFSPNGKRIAFGAALDVGIRIRKLSQRLLRTGCASHLQREHTKVSDFTFTGVVSLLGLFA